MSARALRARLRRLEHRDDDVDPASAGFLLLAPLRSEPFSAGDLAVIHAAARMETPVGMLVAEVLQARPELLQPDGPPLRPNNKKE